MTDTPERTQGVSRLSTALQAAVLAIRWERLWRVLWAVSYTHLTLPTIYSV